MEQSRGTLSSDELKSVEKKVGIWGQKLVHDIFTVQNFCLHRHDKGILPAIRF